MKKKGFYLTGFWLLNGTTSFLLMVHGISQRGGVGYPILTGCILAFTIIYSIFEYKDESLSESQTELATELLRGLLWPIWPVFRFIHKFSKLKK